MPLVLPHELIGALHSTGRLAELCKAEDVQEYWAHFRRQAACNAEVGWPLNAPEGALPIGLHGDDCRFTDGGQKIIVFSSNLILDDSQMRYPLFAIRYVTWPKACVLHCLFGEGDSSQSYSL